ncbi:hypothetical protein OIDMADRAFT_34121 [Oidiodendron maius Zn]|uniref:Gylcosyl hydrolase 115 C-terminal domain-containing protein n=1 Tax=Oidiodendron maius (strain Zn) TaxID=913774 RepID=A0A0C3GGT3_OIDMZ|nr:hypothetical protein OIDMADRAFT_34121 [Oidiodendron maius Zn]
MTLKILCSRRGTEDEKEEYLGTKFHHTKVTRDKRILIKTFKCSVGLAIIWDDDNVHIGSPSLTAGELPDGWISAVRECVWGRVYKLAGDFFGSGEHTLLAQSKRSNVISERLGANLGGIEDSYSDPPPSFCIHDM